MVGSDLMLCVCLPSYVADWWNSVLGASGFNLSFQSTVPALHILSAWTTS